MNRHTVRYWCFRFRTALEPGGNPSEGEPAGLREAFETDPYFGGWENFGVTWDVNRDEPMTIVPLRYSLEAEWNSAAYANARDLPTRQE